MKHLLITCRQLIEEVQGTSAIEKRCVFDLVNKDDSDNDHRDKLSRAFAICRRSLQKSGRVKKGTSELTKMGSRRSSGMAHKKDHEMKNSGFEQMVIAARKKS